MRKWNTARSCHTSQEPGAEIDVNDIADAPVDQGRAVPEPVLRDLDGLTGDVDYSDAPISCIEQPVDKSRRSAASVDDACLRVGSELPE